MKKDVGNYSRSRFLSYIDGIFSRGMKGQFFMFCGAVVLVWIIASLVVTTFFGGKLIEGEVSPWLSVYYMLHCGIDMDPSLPLSVQILMIVLGLIGFVIFTGGLIAVCSNMIERRVELVQKGLVHYKHRNHYLIIGNGEAVNGLIESIHDGNVWRLVQGVFGEKNSYNGEDIVIVPNGDVESERERIFAKIQFEASSRKHVNRIYFYYNGMETQEQIAKLYPELAQAIFIIGDKNCTAGRDVRNLSCMGELSRLIEIRTAAAGGLRERPVPIFIEVDRPETFSILQKVDRIPFKSSESVFLHPFSVHENCARKLWGLYGSSPNGKRYNVSYRPLDYVPITADSNRFVHLVIVGLGEAGMSLLLEALRICHYANFEKRGRKTRITVVDRDFEAKRDSFFAQFPNLEQIRDIELEFVARNAESEPVRAMLAKSATDPDCLLTVAVCLSDPEVALSVGINFPEAVYRYDSGVKPRGNSVLIRQTELGELANSVDEENVRYRYVKVFGAFEDDFDSDLLNDKIPMRINYDYDCFSAQGGDPLGVPVADISSDAAKRAMERSWFRLPEYKRWSNRFQAEMFRTYLRTIGYDLSRVSGETRIELKTMRVIQKSIRENKEILSDMEHRRWCAEKTLSGFSAGPVKDEVRRVHCDICPVSELSEEKKNLSFRPILNIATFLLDEKWTIVKYDEREDDAAAGIQR